MKICALLLAAGLSTFGAVSSHSQEVPGGSTVSSGAASLPIARPKRETVSVVMDQALVVRAPDKIRTMILGNPAIADIASEGKGMLVITGKSYGSTNLVLIDEEGRVAGETLIQVGPPRAGVVTVQKGETKEAYSCTPRCMPMVHVGTTPTFFSEASSQAQQRYGQQGAGSAPAPAPAQPRR